MATVLGSRLLGRACPANGFAGGAPLLSKGCTMLSGGPSRKKCPQKICSAPKDGQRTAASPQREDRPLSQAVQSQPWEKGWELRARRGIRGQGGDDGAVRASRCSWLVSPSASAGATWSPPATWPRGPTASPSVVGAASTEAGPTATSPSPPTSITQAYNRLQQYLPDSMGMGDLESDVMGWAISAGARASTGSGRMSSISSPTSASRYMHIATSPTRRGAATRISSMATPSFRKSGPSRWRDRRSCRSAHIGQTLRSQGSFRLRRWPAGQMPARQAAGGRFMRTGLG